MTDAVRRACCEFLVEFPDYDSVSWDGGEVVLYRPGSTEPFVAGEYRLGTRTAEAFEELAGVFEGHPDFVYTYAGHDGRLGWLEDRGVRFIHARARDSKDCGGK